MQASVQKSASRGKSKKSKLMTPQQFQDEISKRISIAKQLDRELLDVKAAKLAGKQADQQQASAQQPSYNLNKIRSLKTSNLRLLKRLATEYSRSYRLVGEDRVGSANSAFSNPVVVREALITFFRGADLGNLAGSQTPVQAVLSIFLQPTGGNPALASRSILASALSLYAKRHSLYTLSEENKGKPQDQMNRQVLGADAYMLQTLAPLFDELERSSALKLSALGLRDGAEKPQNAKKPRKYYRENDDATRTRVWNDFEHAFNRRNFSYSAFQSLFSAGGIVDKKAQLANPQLGQGVDFSNYVIPKEYGRIYMDAISRLKEAAAVDPQVMANPQATFVAIAQQAAGGQQIFALQIRAALDTVHTIVASASSQYNQKSPAKKSKAKKQSK